MNDHNRFDRDTIKAIATLLGVSEGHVIGILEEKEREQKAYWKRSKKGKGHKKPSRVIGDYIKLFEFEGKELFFSFTSGIFLVNVFGEVIEIDDSSEALHVLATY